MNPFASLYVPYNHEMAAFGAAWCGPERYEHDTDHLVARWSGCGDGQPVEVWCCAMPARFYRIKVLAGLDSMGKIQEPWELATGSGVALFAAEIADAIASGMLSFQRPNYGITLVNPDPAWNAD